MDWPSYLRKVVSRSAVAAAGAAAGMAAAAGGPMAVVSAKAAAEKVSDDLLAQFLGAHDDQMQRIEELSLEMRGRLTGLQNTVGGLLDAPWRTALAHIEEAGRRPSSRAQELELARIRLFDAWGVAESLLERDPRSLDPAALRCPLIAQQIAAVYSFLGEPQNTGYWLANAYRASRKQLDNQVGWLYDIFVQKMKGAKGLSSRQVLPTSISVYSRDWESKDPLWVGAGGGRAATSLEIVRVKRDLDFEGRLTALVELDAEAQLLRLACLDAGADGTALRPGTEPRLASMHSVRDGERRVLIGDCQRYPGDTSHGYHRLKVLVAFHATTAALVEVDLGTERPPIERLIDERYRQLLPFEIWYNWHDKWWS